MNDETEMTTENETAGCFSPSIKYSTHSYSETKKIIYQQRSSYVHVNNKPKAEDRED